MRFVFERVENILEKGVNAGYTGIVSFSLFIFNKLVSQGCKNLRLYYKGLTLYQNDKILDGSNLKAFADDKINVSEKLKFVLGR